MKKKSILEEIEKDIQNFEFKNRNYLSRHKFLYAILGATGVVLYWRGIWHTVDFFEMKGGILSIIFSPLGSMILGILILMSIGLLVQEFIGSDIIISGIRKEKRDIDKTEEEILKEVKTEKEEYEIIKDIKDTVHAIEKEIED